MCEKDHLGGSVTCWWRRTVGTRVPGVWAPADDGGPMVTEVVETLVGAPVAGWG